MPEAEDADPGKMDVGDEPVPDTADVPVPDAADSEADSPDPLADLCAPCSDDDECGGPADLCITVGEVTGCSVDCAANPGICPQGFACGDVVRGGDVVGRQCLPTGMFVEHCGVCGGDDSSCMDCAGVPNGTALLDGCGVCSGGTTGHLADSDKDCAGVCFGGKVMDCNGVCGGGAVLDRCGVCGGDGSSCADCAGVLGGTAFLDGCGVCSGGTSGHVADSDKDCAGACFGTAVVDCTGVCRGTAVVDCAGVCKGTAAVDDCGACSGGTSGHVANSDKDCAGTCFGTAVKDCAGACNGTAAVDDCGTCSGGTSGHVANSDKDCLGICFGDAVVDCNGVCDGGAVVDRCGVCGGDGAGCADCMGVVDGEAFLDLCGVCSEGTSGHVANSDEDCAGVCFGTAALDDCGICSGGTSGHVANSDKDCTGNCFGDAVYDCAGTCAGTATVDHCGTCDADAANDCVKDCAGVWGGSATPDSCGVCSGGTSGHVADSDQDCAGACFGHAMPDCQGVCAGGAFIDDCGVCSAGTTGHVGNSDKDCAGVCFGTAVEDCRLVCGGPHFLDDCGVCSGGVSGHVANSDKDCAGVCFGDAEIDCAGVCDGAAYLDNCGVCDADPANDCPSDCAGVPGGEAALDDCGVCSGGTSGHVANSDKDVCGVCFGPGMATWYQDLDGDGIGNAAVTQDACTRPAGYASSPQDCDDANLWIRPGRVEIPGDGIDQDCDGQELCFADPDHDATWKSRYLKALVLMQTGGGGYPIEAVSRMNFSLFSGGTFDETSFVTQFGNGGNWDLLIVELGTTAPGSGLRSAIEHHVVTNGRPAIVMYEGLDQDAAMQALLEVTAPAAHSGCTIAPAADCPTSLFDLVEAMPASPATTGTCCEVVPLFGAPAYARISSESGSPVAITWSRGGLVLVGGMRIAKESDADADAVKDGIEFYVNAIALQMSQFDARFLADGRLLPSSDLSCQAAGTLPVASTGDCDDTTCGAACNIHQVEVCDGYDNDCNGIVDNVFWFADADGDGAGNAAVKYTGCPQPSGYVANDDDCDDSLAACGAACNPAATEVCDGWDNDCDGLVDDLDPSLDPAGKQEFFNDGDRDGYGDETVVVWACPSADGIAEAGGRLRRHRRGRAPGGDRGVRRHRQRLRHRGRPAWIGWVHRLVRRCGQRWIRRDLAVVPVLGGGWVRDPGHGRLQRWRRRDPPRRRGHPGSGLHRPGLRRHRRDHHQGVLRQPVRIRRVSRDEDPAPADDHAGCAVRAEQHHEEARVRGGVCRSGELLRRDGRVEPGRQHLRRLRPGDVAAIEFAGQPHLAGRLFLGVPYALAHDAGMGTGVPHSRGSGDGVRIFLARGVAGGRDRGAAVRGEHDRGRAREVRGGWCRRAGRQRRQPGRGR